MSKYSPCQLISELATGIGVSVGINSGVGVWVGSRIGVSVGDGWGVFVDVGSDVTVGSLVGVSVGLTFVGVGSSVAIEESKIMSGKASWVKSISCRYGT